MDRDSFYTSAEWREVRERVLTRDGNRCSIARLLGGECSDVLHVHHLIPREERPDLELDEDNLISACGRHHPSVEMIARLIRAFRGDVPTCRHKHPYASGREECERRRRRERLARLERRVARVA